MSETTAKELKTDLYRASYSINTIALPTASADDLDQYLTQKIDVAPEFYAGSNFILNIEGLNDLSLLDFEKLKEIGLKHNIVIIGVSGITDTNDIIKLQNKGIRVINANRFAKTVDIQNNTSKVIVKTLEVKVPVEVQMPYEVKVPVEIPVNSPLVLVTRPIRSGETINAPGNSVIVFGSVNDGARIIASHHIIVFGDVLRGELFAGAPRNQDDIGMPDAFIYTTGTFDPNIVAIAGQYQTAEEIERDQLIGPINNNNKNIVVSLEGISLKYWNTKDFKPKKATKGY